MDAQLLSRKSLAALAFVGLLSVGCGGGGGAPALPGEFGPLPGTPVITAATPVCMPTGPVIRLTWESAPDALDYLVFRDGVVRSGRLFARDLSYDDPADSVPTATYRYVVRAMNQFGFTESVAVLVGVSPKFCALPPPPPPPAPGPFAIESAVPHCALAGPAILVTWTASSGAAQYEVFRDGVLRAASLPEGMLSFDDDAGVLAGGTHHYLVRAANLSGAVDAPIVGVAVPADVCPVAPPPTPGPFAIVEATPHCTPGGPAVRLTWTASEHATAYEVIRLDLLFAIPVPGDTLAFEDTDGIVAGGAYSYFVRALNGPESMLTDMLDVNVPLDVCPPLPPVPPLPFMITTLMPYSNGAVAEAPAPAILVQWAPQAGATGYEVFRDEVLVSTLLGSDAVEFEDTVGIVEGGVYIFFVRAYLPVDSTDTPRLAVHVPLGLVPPPPPPVPASERIVNGDFTAGDIAWILSGNFLASTDGLDSRTAPGYALGGVDGFGIAVDDAIGEMHQTVAIPANATTPTLSFYYRVGSSDVAPGAVDTLDVTIDDGVGAHLATVVTLSNLDNAPLGQYTLVTFDLSAFKGQTIRVAFSVATNSADPTSFQIDDVSVLADGN